MSFSDRRATLLRLLKIEEDIKDIEHSHEYLTMKRGLKALQTARSGGGGGIIVVNSPDDLTRIIEMRKNSPDIDIYIGKYRAKMKRNVDMIDNLQNEKMKLKRELTTAIR
jgi:hypothetical protein